MQAVILAAGMGKRLKELTKDNTKCMIKVNGVTLIERMITQLEKFELEQIVIVIGYEGEKLKKYIATLDIKTPIVYVNNPIYDKTNNIYSLSLAKDYLCKDNTLLFESDLIFEDSVIEVLLEDERETLALVDKYESWMDGTCVKISESDCIEAFVPGSKFKFEEIKDYYKTVNIYKFSKEFSEKYYVPFLEAYSMALGNNEYYEQVLRVITMLDDTKIKAKRLNGQLWYEIDDIQDLDIATSMFAKTDEERVEFIQKRYGGYWRYPKVLDFCYLVNPYFPPQKLMDEIKSNFEKLIMQYPSGMGVNSLLAAKNFGVNQKNIMVGNGAAELIKALMETFCGNIGIVRPTFEEYPHRYAKEKIVEFDSEATGFVYDADKLIEYFADKSLEALLIINPDNPTGNYIPREQMMRLIEWAGKEQIKLVVDESFVDFADEKDATLLVQEVLDSNEHLIVVKSISKSYGVPGLRLGILASGNVELVEGLKKDVSIWNINSFAEFYMQIEEKYKKDYKESLELMRQVRTEFVEGLKDISGVKVYDSQANYLMVEIVNGMSAREVAKEMLISHNMFVKDLSGKMRDKSRQMFRVAIRTREENSEFVNKLKKICD